MSFASQVIKYKRYGRSDKEEEIFAATRGNGVFVLIAKQREWKRSEKYLMRFVRSGTPCLSTHADYLAGCHAILLCAHAHVSRTTWQIASVRESEQPARCGWYSRGCVYDKINELDSLSLSRSLFRTPSHLTPIYHSLSFFASSLLSAPQRRLYRQLLRSQTSVPAPLISPSVVGRNEGGPEKISYESSLRHCTSKTNSRCVLHFFILRSWMYRIRYNVFKGLIEHL